MIVMTLPGIGVSGSPELDIHLACAAAGNNYALGIASTMARASEKMNICQRGPVTDQLVGG